MNLLVFLNRYLDDHGYVVFRNIATQEELQQGKELFWKFMGASFPAIKRDNIFCTVVYHSS